MPIIRYKIDDNNTALSLVSIIKITEPNPFGLGWLFPGTAEIAKVGRFKKKSAFLDNAHSESIEQQYLETNSPSIHDKLIKEFEKRVIKRLK